VAAALPTRSNGQVAFDLQAEVEQRVAERTAELEVALSNLQAQISQHAKAEAAHRESEARYRRIVELSPEAILIVSDREMLYANPAAARLFGAPTVSDLLRQNPLHLVSGSDRERVAASVRRLIQSGEVALLSEARLQRVDGTPLDGEITAAGVTFDGRPALQVMIRDIGERKAVERMKDELLSIVSHELRTPLTSIRGALGLLAGGVLGALPPTGQRMLDIAVANSDRLIRLLNDVLDLERMRAGQVTLKPIACQAAELVQAAAAEIRVLAERTGIDLVIDPAEGTAYADSDRVVQVLTNLLSNAIKFSEPGGRVQVRAERVGEHVRFAVRDEGRGIPPDKLETIFERFHQVDATDSREKGGSGLGLAICKSIVQQHAGRIWAESTPGVGSTFFVELRAA
jgi:PAS domain S-box-containing protein